MEIFDRQLPSTEVYRGGEDAYQTGPDFHSVNLREVLAKFWLRKRLIFLCIFVCASLAFLLTKVMPPAYTAEAEIAIKPQQSSVLIRDQNVPVATQVGPETVQTEVYALQSRTLVSTTIKELQLDRDPEFNPSLRKPDFVTALLAPALAEIQGWVEPWLPGGTKPETPSDKLEVPTEADKSADIDEPSTSVIDALLSRLRVTVQQNSNVIQVSFKSSRRIAAAAVPNMLIKNYLDQQTAEKDQTLVQEREQLDKLILPKFREKMEASERALAEYRQQSGVISDRNATELSQELSATRAQSIMARTRTAEATTRLQEAERTSVSPAAASEPRTIERLREREVTLQGQVAGLNGLHGPNYPQTMQLEAQLKEFKNGITRERSDAVSRLKTDLSVAQQTEAALSKRVTELTHQFFLVNGGDAQLENLIGEADADRKAYERYLARSNELRSSIGHAQPDASLLSPAGIPLKPSPSPKLVVLGGITIGAGIGIIWVSLLDALLKGLRNERQLEETLGIRCIGLVPKVQKSLRYWFPRRERLSEIREFTLSARHAAFGEAIRSAQMKLLRLDRQIEPQVILITAALPNEGKSWVAASLALSLAADGRSVALVDCDVNRPTVHRMFDGPRGPGLTDYLGGSMALDDIIHHDPASGVWYVPIGSAVPRRTWRKAFSLILPLVDRLGQKYEFVILDSAPVLAVADTIFLSQIVQKTILVIKWASTPPAVARRAAVQLLESAGAELTALLSMVDIKCAAKNGDPVSGVYKQLESYYGVMIEPDHMMK